jgi:hypothetical protein
MLAKIISYSTMAVKHTSLVLRTSKAFKSWSIIALWLLNKREHTGLGGGKFYIADGKDFKEFGGLTKS